MSAILTAIVTGISSGLAKTALGAVQALTEAFKYLNGRRADKKQKARDEAVEKAEAAVDEAVESGSLDDLLDATAQLGKAKGT